MDVTKPYKFIGFGAMDVTKPYKFIGILVSMAGQLGPVISQPGWAALPDPKGLARARHPLSALAWQNLPSFSMGNRNLNFNFKLLADFWPNLAPRPL